MREKVGWLLWKSGDDDGINTIYIWTVHERYCDL